MRFTTMAPLTARVRLILFGTVFFLWVLPVLNGMPNLGMSGHDFERLAQLPLLLAAALWLAIRQDADTRLFLGPTWPVLTRAAMAALVLASAACAAYPSIALRELALFVGLVSLAKALSAHLREEETVTLLLRLLAAATLVYAALVMLMLAAALSQGPVYDPWDLLTGFDNPRFLNHAQTIALPLVASVATDRRDKAWQRIGWAALVFSGMLLFITYGRATMLALTVGLAGGLCFFRRRSLSYAIHAFVPTLLGFLVAWGIYLQWMRSAGFRIHTAELAKLHFRDYLAEQAFQLWQRSPWLGVGPMHYAHWYNGEAAHPHNLYVQLLSEYGTPAGLLLIAAAFVWMWRALRSLRRADDANVPLAMGLIIAVIGVAVDAGFSGNFVMPISQTWIALLVALVAGFHARQGAATSVARSTRNPVLQRAAYWTMAALLGWLVWVSYGDVRGTTRPVLPTAGAVDAPPNLKSGHPRFWTIGWF